MSEISSITERARPVAVGAPIVAVHFLRDTAVFVAGEEALVFAPADGPEKRVAAHAGAILVSAASDTRVVTGGDDGQVVATEATGDTRVLASDSKRRWIDRVALGPDDSLAWAAGKTAFMKNRKGEEKSLDLPSSAGGLAFAPKGLRLAVAHYNGVSLWFPNAIAEPERLEWKGSHTGVAFSPDGKFLVTAMQEPMLHGWRLADRKHMRMSGYAAKIRSVSWSADGRFLATAGSDQLILWPFHGKDGPMGQTPGMLAPRDVRVVVVACHPVEHVAAVGYADGMVLLVRLNDGAEVLARKPGGSPVSALGWAKNSGALAIGTEDGEAAILAL